MGPLTSVTVAPRLLAIKAKAAKGITFEGFDGFTDWRCGVSDEHEMSVQDVFASALRAAPEFTRKVSSTIPLRHLFYYGDLCAHCGHDVVLEHPDTSGLTFTFESEDMAKYLASYRDTVMS